MADLWDLNSLRGRYSRLIDELKKNHQPVSKKVGFFKGLSSIIQSSKEELDIMRKIRNFICPHCLNAVLFDELAFECPFCNEKYGELTNQLKNELESSLDKENLSDLLGAGFVYTMENKEKEKALFDKCSECGGKIRYVECYKCHKPIDLFAPYDEEELERKRYE